MAKLSLERIRMQGIEALSQCDDPQRWHGGEQRALGEVRRGLFGRHYRRGDRLDGRSIRWNCDNSHYEGGFFWVVSLPVKVIPLVESVDVVVSRHQLCLSV